MKICPICKQTYEDQFRFCTNDGASLGERPAPAALASPDPVGVAPDAAPGGSGGLKLAAVEEGTILPEPSQPSIATESTGPPIGEATIDEPAISAVEAPFGPSVPAPSKPETPVAPGGEQGGHLPQDPRPAGDGARSVPQTEDEYQADLESISTLRAQFESSTALPVIEPTDDDLRYLIKASRPAWIPWAFVGGALVALAVAGWLFFSGGDDATSAGSGGDVSGTADQSGPSTQSGQPAVGDAASAQDKPKQAVDAAALQRPAAGPDLGIDSAPPAPPPTQVAAPSSDGPKAVEGDSDKLAVKSQPRTKPRRKRVRSSKRKARAKKRRARRKTRRKRSRRARRETTIDPFAE